MEAILAKVTVSCDGCDYYSFKAHIPAIRHTLMPVPGEVGVVTAGIQYESEVYQQFIAVAAQEHAIKHPGYGSQLTITVYFPQK